MRNNSVNFFFNLGQWFRRCLLKDFLSGALWCSWTIYAILKDGIIRNSFMWSYMEFGPVVQKKMLIKDISYLELWPPLCLADPNHLCNFGRRYHEEQFCEIILNLDQWFRRNCHSKAFLIWISGSPFVQYSVTICAILLEGILRNNSVRLFWIWVSGSGADVV